jgi:hypothetical protein
MQVNVLLTRKRLAAILVLVAALVGCKDEEMDPFTANVSSIVEALDYDPDKLLNVQPIGNEPAKRTETGTENGSSSQSGGYIVSCGKKKYTLQTNTEEIAILKNLQGKVWPGALIKGNASLLDGEPDTLLITRAPIRLQVDLPDIGSAGTVSINNPTDSSVQAGIASALNAWNTNAYQEGYSNPDFLVYKTAGSYSAQQVSLDLGLNSAWASPAVTAQLNVPSTTAKKVAMLAVHQGFYTVSMPAPGSPAAFFGQEGTIGTVEESVARIRATLKPEAPPAYVQSVMYGRILVIRLETALPVTPTDVEIALQYASGTTTLAGESESRAKTILANSTQTLIAIGKNGTISTQNIGVRSSGELSRYITDKSALYSATNPGVPISYTVRFLKANRVARMGYAANYSVDECLRTLVPGAPVSLVNSTGQGQSVGWDVQYTLTFKNKDNADQSLTSGTIKKGESKVLNLPEGAYNISMEVEYKDGNKWKRIGEQSWSLPTKMCFESYGNWQIIGKKEPELRTVTCK